MSSKSQVACQQRSSRRSAVVIATLLFATACGSPSSSEGIARNLTATSESSVTSEIETTPVPKVAAAATPSGEATSQSEPDAGRRIIADVLTDKYADLVATGWTPTKAEIERDVKHLLGGAFEAFLKA